ncbi:cobalamin B12-binding domain-containing protein [Methanolobus zinderi]|uniref:Cobalamin B12-binding domain-containing protein n=1 Tax=Methanolobus zinderi TaxID=536044 RepID=A0A7D5EEZ2_9EURY|nr:dimethylamine corrinoid protein MtbC [Methanolobus zinderi]QLC48940.1 cobalamin B12-binding domain-containing protein [Methanolobus zinderi]
MSNEEMFKELSDAIVSCKKDAVIATVEKARDEGIPPAEIIEKGLAAGMNEVGVLFERGKLFLPHVMMAAGAMEAGVALLEKDMPKDAASKKLGIIVNGTVEGDVHDIGKSIVSTMLQSSGFEVHDIGRDVPLQDFIDKAKETSANMIGMSALMTTTLPGQKDVIEMLKEQGMRDGVKVMVGGAPATEAWANKIGADCYAENASEAVTKAKELLL